MRADEMKVDAFGGVAVATFALDYSFRLGTNAVHKRANTTMVFIREDGSWKITHEHISPPRPGP